MLWLVSQAQQWRKKDCSKYLNERCMNIYWSTVQYHHHWRFRRYDPIGYFGVCLFLHDWGYSRREGCNGGYVICKDQRLIWQLTPRNCSENLCRLRHWSTNYRTSQTTAGWSLGSARLGSIWVETIKCETKDTYLLALFCTYQKRNRLPLPWRVPFRLLLSYSCAHLTHRLTTRFVCHSVRVLNHSPCE